MHRGLLLRFRIGRRRFRGRERGRRHGVLSRGVRGLRRLMRGKRNKRGAGTRGTVRGVLVRGNFAQRRLSGPRAELLSVVREQVRGGRSVLGRVGIRDLSFGSFCRFSLHVVPVVYGRGGVSFSVAGCGFLLGGFCGKKRLRGALGRSFSASLFRRPFVIFRVSTVGSSPRLFPVMALVVVSIFVRGVELGGGEGTLVVRRT